jgi:hypothetical protein
METSIMALYSDVVNSTMDFSNITTTGATISGYKTGRVDLGTVSGTVALNLAVANDFTATVNGNTTFSITNTPSVGVVGFSLQIVGGGGYTITFTNAKYPAATAPALTSGAGIDVITFITYDNGTSWRGTIAMKDSR